MSVSQLDKLHRMELARIVKNFDAEETRVILRAVSNELLYEEVIRREKRLESIIKKLYDYMSESDYPQTTDECYDMIHDLKDILSGYYSREMKETLQ